MFGKEPHADETLRPLEDLRFTDPSVPARACCCPARPAVKVIMPPTANRKEPVDLWLCGHHYRASVAALVKARARVEDLTMPSIEHPQSDHAELIAHRPRGG